MKRLVFILLILVLFSGCVGQGSTEYEGSYVIVTNSLGDEIIVKVEIADDNEERMQGLMHRESLDEDAGMWFVFEDEDFRSFWMKNTLIPLDIIYIDSDFTIVDIKEDVQPCEAEPCPTYPSGGTAMYVLEVNAGFSEANKIAVGDKAELVI
jgi:uncharacterized membrane protein (UPF0127 family)